MSTFIDTDHKLEAERYLNRADEILNRDGDLTYRYEIHERYVNVAGVHAQLAVAQRLAEVQDRLGELAAISDVLETKLYPAIAEGI